MIIFPLVLAVHIFFGSMALFAGLVAMMHTKGGRWHRQAGKLFLWSMGIVAGTAAYMALVRTGFFLLLIAIFSFYLAFTGYRALARKKSQDPVSLVDWVATWLGLLGSVALVVMGGMAVLQGGYNGIAQLVFGCIGLALGISDVRRYRRPLPDPRAWWYAHMVRMLAAYIATLSAISVVNFTFLPPIVSWLWPTVIGTPCIIIWARYYQRRFANIDARRAEKAAMRAERAAAP